VPESIPSKLNIGCGYDKRAGYLNVDMDPACKPDLLITDNDFSSLPRQHFDEVLAHDVLEHIGRAQTGAALLEWIDLLKVGGTLVVQTSSILGVAQLLERHQNYVDQANFTIYLFGNQAHPGDFHHTGFTEATLKIHLIAAGLEIEDFELRDAWLFHVRARKHLDWTRLLAATVPNAEFLKLAYEEALFRQADEYSLNLLVGQIETGRSRRDVLKQFYSSEERRMRISQQRSM
jgi:predicted SAM-dependent methyltransferase